MKQITQSTLCSSGDEEEFIFDVKPKRNPLRNLEELQKLEQKYRIKRKTELCHNFSIRGACKFKENCSFAHGKHELQGKEVMRNFKTKPCKNYFKDGVCAYGQRCQYMHEEVKNDMKWWGYVSKYYKKYGTPYTFACNRGDLPNYNQQTRIDQIRFSKINQTLQIFDNNELILIFNFSRLQSLTTVTNNI